IDQERWILAKGPHLMKMVVMVNNLTLNVLLGLSGDINAIDHPKGDHLDLKFLGGKSEFLIGLVPSNSQVIDSCSALSDVASRCPRHARDIWLWHINMHDTHVGSNSIKREEINKKKAPAPVGEQQGLDNIGHKVPNWKTIVVKNTMEKMMMIEYGWALVSYGTYKYSRLDD
ncbi:hypothetical protein ACJX0J_006205, partial [Zea mays]